MPQLLCLITVYLHTTDSKKKTLLIFSVHCSSTPGGQTQSLTMAEIQTRLSISGGWAQYRRLGEHITALVTGHSRVHTHSFAVWLASVSSKDDGVTTTNAQILYGNITFSSWFCVFNYARPNPHSLHSELAIHCGVSDAALNPNGNLTQPCKPPAGRFVQ